MKLAFSKTIKSCMPYHCTPKALKLRPTLRIKINSSGGETWEDKKTQDANTATRTMI